ncbi:MAG: hypothetical protein H0X03_09825 [Nitrosopumilus sp.]|nr:hypothetical protein [Nitrosopumilus sp.]
MFLGLAIISSIIFSKILLNKTIAYNWPYAIISMLCLMASVAIAIVPLITITNLNGSTIGWIFMFLFGVFAYSLTNVLQEKFIRESQGQLFVNKIYLAFTSSICQFITIIVFSWLDLFIGYSTDGFTTFDLFKNSFNTMVTDLWALLVLQIFIVLWFCLFILALFLNEISTNYTMILTNITNQSVALFFIIFPGLNHGLKYPLFITLSSLATSFISVLFWVNAEKVIDENTSDEEKMNIID